MFGSLTKATASCTREANRVLLRFIDSFAFLNSNTVIERMEARIRKTVGWLLRQRSSSINRSLA